MKKIIILVVAILAIGAGVMTYISSKDSNNVQYNNEINTQNTISSDTTNSNTPKLSKAQDNIDNEHNNVSTTNNTDNSNSSEITNTNSHKIVDNSNNTSVTKNNLNSSEYSISEFYGTWKATKVCGACPINTGTTASEENRLLTINKNGASFGDFVTHTHLYIKKIDSNQFWNENRCYPKSANLSADSLYEITNSDEIIPIYILDSNDLVVSADGMFFLYTRV